MVFGVGDVPPRHPETQDERRQPVFRYRPAEPGGDSSVLCTTYSKYSSCRKKAYADLVRRDVLLQSLPDEPPPIIRPSWTSPGGRGQQFSLIAAAPLSTPYSARRTDLEGASPRGRRGPWERWLEKVAEKVVWREGARGRSK